MSKYSSVIIWLLAAGCAGSQGTRPDDTSAAKHEAAATQEEQNAEAHAHRYEPAAGKDQTRCESLTQVGLTCWTSRVNPTAQHLKDVARHRELAAQHRAAAHALRQAEAQACAGIDAEDRDVSPFFHREDIVSVATVETGPPGTIYTTAKQPNGARFVFRAVPGLTSEWLQRQVNCHVARAAALGHDVAEMSYCPLMLKNVRASVSSVGDGLAVEVTSNDAEIVKEIQRRARALAPDGEP